MPLLDWNILVTAKEVDQRQLLRQLRRFGNFRRTRFRGVLVGWVEDPSACLEGVRCLAEEQPEVAAPLSKLVPMDRIFPFTIETFVDRLKEAVLLYADRIGNGSFYVRLERRGHKGDIHSQHVEQELDQALVETLTKQGMTPTVDFKDPDLIIIAETVGEICGIGAIPRQMRARYPFVKVP